VSVCPQYVGENLVTATEVADVRRCALVRVSAHQRASSATSAAVVARRLNILRKLGVP
jgi:hypothetical protein